MSKQDLKAGALSYVDLTGDTLESLAFVHDNIGERVDLDLSVESLSALESILESIHRHPDPDDLLPDLLETYAQLVSQYCALASIGLCQGFWEVDLLKSSAFFGQPYVEVVPGQPWRRFYPIDTQIALRDPRVVFSKHRSSLSRLLAENVRARERFDELVEAVETILLGLPERAATEEQLLDSLRRTGFGPEKAEGGLFMKAFRDRVGAALRRSGCFTRRRRDRLWTLKRVAT